MNTNTEQNTTSRAAANAQIRCAQMDDFAAIWLVETPPIECGFKVGDAVIYTNSNGAEFRQRVIGFANERAAVKKGVFVHLDMSCYWSPVSPSELTLIEG